jgi:hypothetical protein
VSAGAHANSTPIAVRRHDPAVALSLFGGGVLLVEALVAALLISFDDLTVSPLRTTLLLGVGGLLALIAAHLVLTAPRLASFLCLLALAPAAAVQLPVFDSRLRAHLSPGSFSPTNGPTLGAALAPLLAWLLAAAPLVCAAFLAWRRAVRVRRGPAG